MPEDVGQVERRTALTDDDRYFAAAVGLAKNIMGIDHESPAGWRRRSRKRGRGRLRDIFEEADDTSDSEDFCAELRRLRSYERRHPEHPMAVARARCELTSRQQMILWILLVDRMQCADAHLGYPIQQLARMVGLERPSDVARLFEIFGVDGSLKRHAYLRHLEEGCRLVEVPLALTKDFAQALLGEGASIEPYIGDQSERSHPHAPPWAARRERQESQTPSHTKPPSRPLVLPPEQRDALSLALRQVPLRRRVADELGYRDLLGYGLGSIFLFEGAPGTGKTLAASVVAHELDKPLMKVPTARLLNAYVGGTESRIHKVFEQAKAADAVLLLDEADSLLGDREKAVRSWEVSQVNTLLHCIEHFEGVVILTTNFVRRLDTALERRLSLRMRFERPGPTERAHIWRELIGERFEIQGISLAEMAARFPLTGSQIKTAVLELAMEAIEDPGRAVTADAVEAAIARSANATASMASETRAGF